MMREEIFFSIDFEDFAHDIKRDLGIWKTGLLREEGLWESYNDIQSFLKLYKNVKITFFCTAVIAKQLPDLINKISQDGHEIACHYYYHDEMNKQSIKDIEKYSSLAKETLENISGSKVVGFRAPKFRIDKDNPDQYKVISNLFKYDSSWFGNDIDDLKNFLLKMKLVNFSIFPIFSEKVIYGLPSFKLGGSYLKLFPKNISSKLIKGAQYKNITPHIYLHPYELSDKGYFLLTMKELKVIGFSKKLYWYLRQHQWHTLGNSKIKNKLISLIGNKKILGRLCDNLEKSLSI